MPAPRTVSENQLVLLLSAVQFVNVLDFVMVLPLGPDFVAALGMPPSALGLVGGSYTAAAAVGGLIGATFLDRFDRRQALAVAVAGLVIATAAGGFAVDFYSLLASRVVAGAMGGPATALCLAIIADQVPLERRGRAMGTFMSAFSVASVVGVPAGLELARVVSWRLPFFAVAAIGLLIVPLAYMLLPPLRAHLDRTTNEPAPSFLAMLRPSVLLSLCAVGFAMTGTFLLVPNISGFVQLNLGYPREKIGLLYLCGGAVSFLTVRIAGRLTDRYGPLPVATGAVTAFLVVIYLAFVNPTGVIPVVPLYAAFMVVSTFRFVPMQALSSRVPNMRERARFMSLQSTVQHAGSSMGAMLSSIMLGSDSHGALTNMDNVGWLAIVLTASLPFLLYALQARVGTPLAQAA
ncbi:MAG TPA: MFS transporter [Polyangiales bacterium]|nr:MFS transporter [Polyangiales bacterium]